MQIPHQLEGKQKAMELYITFLKEHCLWNRVSLNEHACLNANNLPKLIF